MGDVYTLLCFRSAELSKTFGLLESHENSSQNENKYALHHNAAYLNS